MRTFPSLFLFLTLTLASTSALADVDDALHQATAVPGGLTADQVAARAQKASPRLAARREDAAAAGAARTQAKLALIPRVTVSGRYTRLSDIGAVEISGIEIAPSIVDQEVATAQLAIPLSDDWLRVRPSIAAARHTARAAAHAVDAERRRGAAEARLAYYGWARARLAAVIADAAVAQAEGHLRDVQNRAGAARAQRADVLRVQSQLAAAQASSARAHDLADAAAEQLRTLMDDAPGAQYEIGEDLLGEPIAPPVAATVDQLAAAAVRARPELAAASESAASLRDQARAARAATLPRLDLVGDVTAGHPNPRYLPAREEWNTTWSAGVQLSWALGEAPAAHAGARAIDHRRAAAEQERRALDDAVRIEIAQALAGVRDAAAVQDAASRGLAAAEEGARVREALFREGLATTVELLDADTDLTRARLEVLNARIDAKVARIRLDHALGAD